MIFLSKSMLPLDMRTQSSEALDRAIGEGVHAVNASDARGFFKHCGYASNSFE